MIELKPCPFCGGEPYFLKPRHEKGTAFDTMMIECKHCGALPYGVSVYDGKKEEDKKAAIAKFWNKRTHDWISVKERLPECESFIKCNGFKFKVSADVLLWNESEGYMFVGSYDYSNNSWLAEYDNPTHWMKLPEPPTLEGDE